MKADDNVQVQLRRPLHRSGQVIELALDVWLFIFKINGPVSYRNANSVETSSLNCLKVTLIQERLPVRPQQLRARILAKSCTKMPFIFCRGAVIQRRRQPRLGQQPSAQIDAPDLAVCDLEEVGEGYAESCRQALARHGQRRKVRAWFTIAFLCLGESWRRYHRACRMSLNCVESHIQTLVEASPVAVASSIR